MESNFHSNSGLPAAFHADRGSAAHGPDMWRPWTGESRPTNAHRVNSVHGDLCDPKSSKAPQFVHPVKLFWPKSRCFDYLFQDAEMLLRNYPVQATICVYQDSSSEEEEDDEDDDEDEEEEEDEEMEMEKQLN